MNTKPVPYQRTIFVCTNSRDEDGRPSCAKRGSEAICQALKDEIHKRGLKGKVRAMKSGCQDFCEEGPSVMIFPEGTLKTGVTIENISSLLE